MSARRDLKPVLRLCLACLLAVGVLDALALGLWHWGQGHTFSGTTSGVWTALADEFARGRLYRPVFSEDGYGGTRYMPLSFIGHGLLMKLGLGPTAAGVLWMQAGVLAMVALIAVVLRQSGLGAAWALAVAVTSLCTSIYQDYVTQVHADYAAAALSLGALSVFLARGPLILVALLGALAFFTKLTALYVPAAILTALIAQGAYARALGFAVCGVALVAVGAVGLQALSGGQMGANLAVALTGGTEGLGFALGFPYRFAEEIFVQNPAIGITFVVAAWIWRKEPWGDVISLCFVYVTLATALTFASRGIAGNHVIPLHAVSLLVIGRALFRSGWAAPLGFAALLVVSLATFLPGVPSPRKSLVARNEPVIADLSRAVAQWRASGGPIFSLHPGFPPLLGERAFVLDAYNLVTFLDAGGEIAEDFSARIAAREFSLAIIERRNLFLSWFAEEYAQVDRVGRYLILAPRPVLGPVLGPLQAE